VGVLVLLLAAGCASGGGAAPLTPVGQPTVPPGTGPTRPSAPPTTFATVNRMDLLAVYRAWWKAVQTAFARGDADYPELLVYGMDPILTREQDQIRKLRAQGVVQRTQLSLQPRIVHQDEAVATLFDCVRGPAGTYYDLATGRPRAPTGYRNDVPTKESLFVSLQRRSGYWFVTAATDEGFDACRTA
jgi:hypothetical protein